jgi:recombinational DNA repair protein (RecF pathway)
MKGFVVHLSKAKNEDMIVTILCAHSIKAYYRFFGARHSILQLGHLIDFEVDGEQSHFMPRLRSLSHFGFEWLYESNRLLMWHNFIKLFEPHLRETEEIHSFYFELLLKAAQKWSKQNPKRIICESYLALLRFEGRLYDTRRCYICEDPIEQELSLMRAYIAAHPACIHAPTLSKKRIDEFFESGKTISFEDNEIEYLYSVVMKGF